MDNDLTKVGFRGLSAQFTEATPRVDYPIDDFSVLGGCLISEMHVTE